MSSLDNFRRAIRSKALRKDLEAVFDKHGLQILKDDGMWMFLDDYTDTAKIHIREKGWFEKWKQMSGWYKPVPEAKDCLPGECYCEMNGMGCPDRHL